jgi:hypothetical protein
VTPEQHPLEQEAASQTHVPDVVLHSCPEPQLGFVPHRHWPEGEQVLEAGLSQAMHATPPIPHWLAVSPVLHVLSVAQHPSGHEAELQTQLAVEPVMEQI